MNNIYIYALNIREHYDIISALTKSIEKKIKKGIEPSIDILASCSTMANLVRMICRYAAKYKETFTPEEKQQGKREIAEYIIETAKENIA